MSSLSITSSSRAAASHYHGQLDECAVLAGEIGSRDFSPEVLGYSSCFMNHSSENASAAGSTTYSPLSVEYAWIRSFCNISFSFALYSFGRCASAASALWIPARKIILEVKPIPDVSAGTSFG